MSQVLPMTFLRTRSRPSALISLGTNGRRSCTRRTGSRFGHSLESRSLKSPRRRLGKRMTIQADLTTEGVAMERKKRETRGADGQLWPSPIEGSPGRFREPLQSALILEMNHFASPSGISTRISPFHIGHIFHSLRHRQISI
jgi:hypothetical protein